MGPLLGAHGLLSDIMTCGSTGLSEIIKRRWATWRLDVEGSLYADLKNRGVANQSVLPKYYYRDDAKRIHGAISRYVKHIVDHYYGTFVKFTLIEAHPRATKTSSLIGNLNIKGYREIHIITVQ